MSNNLVKLQNQCDEFNKKYPVGTEVIFKKNSFIDSTINTKVTHEAYVLGEYSAVAFFEGVRSCYEISCVKGLANG